MHSSAAAPRLARRRLQLVSPRSPALEPGASASKYTRPATSSGYRAVTRRDQQPAERASVKKVGPGHVRVGQDRVQLARERLRRRCDAGWSGVARTSDSPWAVVAAEAGGGTQLPPPQNARPAFGNEPTTPAVRFKIAREAAAHRWQVRVRSLPRRPTLRRWRVCMRQQETGSFG